MRAKRVVFGIIIAGILSVGIVVGVGMALPQDHVAAVRTTLRAAPETVWERIRDVDSHPDWRSGVDSVAFIQDSGVEAAWREIGSAGVLPMEIILSEPPRRLVTRIRSEGLPFGGRWTFDLEPVTGGSGTRVTIREEGEVYNPIFRFVSQLIIGHHRTATTYLTDLARGLGEGATVERVQ